MPPVNAKAVIPDPDNAGTRSHRTFRMSRVAKQKGWPDTEKQAVQNIRK